MKWDSARFSEPECGGAARCQAIFIITFTRRNWIYLVYFQVEKNFKNLKGKEKKFRKEKEDKKV